MAMTFRVLRPVHVLQLDFFQSGGIRKNNITENASPSNSYSIANHRSAPSGLSDLYPNVGSDPECSIVWPGLGDAQEMTLVVAFPRNKVPSHGKVTDIAEVSDEL